MMRDKCNVMLIPFFAVTMLFGFVASARTFEFKQLKTTGSAVNSDYWWRGEEKSKSAWFQVKIGGASKIDDTSEMEIRAATVLKGVRGKNTGINDVATFEFDPINRGKAIYFMVSSSAASSLEGGYYADSGWQLAGCIIEIWQKGKVVKRWTNVTGKDGKTKLTDDVEKLRINRDGYPSDGGRFRCSRDFDNATEIYSVDQKGERVEIEDVLKPYRDGAAGAKGGSDSSAAAPVKNTVTPKLRKCEFLLNKKFKKKAKFYLCLFSASWCPPCRAEMPRIAKIYAETLKDDPDIELVHFSRDQSEEKALAWAKEHDVKFPVVKPHGGNPLNLQTSGIPHLFIVKADGTLVEEGHPMRIFNEAKIRELKGNRSAGGATPQVCKLDEPSAKGDQSAGGSVVAQKLRQCDFLLNEKFKKKAKVYLCLFSASWCPPCRGEMPRIAKTYAETLKDDPDIELIHFSRDQNDEKAMTWAKEHDVKFPVVKPNGGNPLDLHSRGIPHLFIVKADGTLIEEGHPMRIFNEEKFKELKGMGATNGEKPQDDKEGSSAIEGVVNVTTEGGLFTLTGPYGIRMTADPGCEKGAEYVMKRLVEHYLPRAKEFYGDPFLGEKSSRTYRIDVDQNDGLGNSTYTGPSYGPGTGSWSIGLSKGAERYEMSLDYLASSVLTLCEEPNWASFVFYVNRFVEAKTKGIDVAPRLKEDIRRGLEENDEDGKDNWYRAHAPLWAALEDLRAKHPKLILDYCKLKNKRFSEGKLPKKLSLDQMASLLSEVSGADASALFKKYGVKPK